MIALHSRLTLIAEPLIEYRVHAGQQLGVGGNAVNGEARDDTLRDAATVLRARGAPV